MIPDASYSSQEFSRGSVCFITEDLPENHCVCCVTAVPLVIARKIVGTYAISIAEGLLTTFLLLTNAGGAKAEADAKKSAEAMAVNFILRYRKGDVIEMATAGNCRRIYGLAKLHAEILDEWKNVMPHDRFYETERNPEPRIFFSRRTKARLFEEDFAWFVIQQKSWLGNSGMKLSAVCTSPVQNCGTIARPPGELSTTNFCWCWTKLKSRAGALIDLSSSRHETTMNFHCMRGYILLHRGAN